MIDFPQWLLLAALWLNESALHDWMMSNRYLWSTLETIHFISLCFLLGALAVVDFRLMGVYRTLSYGTAQQLVRIALLAFAVNFASGICFLAGNTWKYIGGNPAFEIKMLLIVILGVNALVFHFRLRSILDTENVSLLSRAVGLISIVLWCLVIICGRMITFFAS